MVGFAKVRGAIEQAGRDARVVARRVVGRRPSPLVRGAARSEIAVRGRDEARVARVVRVVRETATAFTIVLTHDGPFDFLPGQFFTVLAEVDGEIVPRNYSASNAPGGGELHLTIREKPGGRVSPRLARLAPGDALRVLGPFGSFVSLLEDHDRPLVLIAGGAGVTPLMAMLRARPTREITLLYANRSAEDIIFHAELAALAERHPDLTVVHHEGDLDRASAAAILARIGKDREPRFFICGPDGMRDEVLAALGDIGIQDSSIAVERFSIGPRAQAASSGGGARPIAIHIGKRVHRTTALPGATLLEAGLAAGADMPFSCAVGGCGACRVKLTSGDVDLQTPNCLTPRERDAGYVLACVGRPLGPCTIEIG